MTLLDVPFLVLAFAGLLTLRLPFGRDILVPVFLMPWYALEPDIGVGVSIYQFLLIILALKYTLRLRLDPLAMPAPGLILGIIAIGIYSAAVTFNTHTTQIEFVGGEFRNGWLRTLVTTTVFLLSLLPFLFLRARGAIVSTHNLIQAYVVSVLVLGCFGLLQYVVFHLVGVDLFPIGMFNQTEDRYRAATFDIGAGLDIRICSFAGEPKGLGMVTVPAVALILAFGDSLFSSSRQKNLALVLCVLVTYLTQSSSALLSLVIVFAVHFWLRSLRRPLTRSAIFGVYFFAAATLFAYSVYYVANTQLTAYVSTELPRDYLEFLYMRTIGRIEVEDYDWVILKSFLADPSAFIFGRGFGLAHLYVNPFIPDNMRYYMEGGIISPKSGLTLFLSHGGVVAVVLFLMFLSQCTPARAANLATAETQFAERSIRNVQAAVVSLVLIMLLRAYAYDICLLVVAVASVYRGNLDSLMRGNGNAPRVMNSRPRPAARSQTTNHQARQR